MKTLIAVVAVPLRAAGAAAGRAVAVLHAAPGGKVEGTVWFEPAAGGVKVKARVTGLAPGTHGFHVHEFGDCSTADFASAGGHRPARTASPPWNGRTRSSRSRGTMGFSGARSSSTPRPTT